ncbi:MAG: hypothetical protein IPI85_14365 [Dehalococcoidia bacterium]|nr:hypothetical protein [Dehalococcoidia bacterium]
MRPVGDEAGEREAGQRTEIADALQARRRTPVVLVDHTAAGLGLAEARMIKRAVRRTKPAPLQRATGVLRRG